MKVILDTNALILSAEFGIDLFSELSRLNFEEIFVPKAVIRELKGLSKNLKGQKRTAVNVAISFLDRCKIVEIDGDADEVILKLAKEKDASVFTNDKELNQKLVKAGVSVIINRQKRYLSFGKI